MIKEYKEQSIKWISSCKEEMKILDDGFSLNVDQYIEVMKVQASLANTYAILATGKEEPEDA